MNCYCLFAFEVRLLSCALSSAALLFYIIQSTKNLEFKSPKEYHDVWRIKTKVKVLCPPQLEHVKGITVKDKVGTSTQESKDNLG